MAPLYRGMIAGAAVVGLSWAAWATSSQSIAANTVYWADREMNAWPFFRPPAAADAARIATDLRGVLQRNPANPVARDLLGTAAMLQSRDPANYAEAETQFQASLKLRPTSGYTWANYLVTGYSLGIGDAELEHRLRNAVLFGPYEDAAQRIVVDYGLALWPQLSPAAQADVEATIVRGFNRNPPEMLQIAARRGRLDVACRQPIFRTTKPCLGMEATS